MALSLTLMPVNASIGAYHIETNKQYISSTAKCSCSLYSNYNYHTVTWINYCPCCHHYGVLNIVVGSGNHNPEGMAHCTIDDSDYCLVHGKSHDDRGMYLTRTSISNHQPIQQVNPEPNQQPDPKTLIIQQIVEVKSPFDII